MAGASGNQIKSNLILTTDSLPIPSGKTSRKSLKNLSKEYILDELDLTTAERILWIKPGLDTVSSRQNTWGALD